MTIESLSFRETTLADLPIINTILNSVIADSSFNLSLTPKSMEDTKVWLKEHQNNEYYVSLSAIFENQFVGWVSLSPFRSAGGYNITAELSVYVHPDYYRRGIAKQMMLEIENYARKKNKLDNIISVITADNLVSIALHNKMGYNTCGIFKDIALKDGLHYDVVFMMKRIISDIY